MTILSAADLAEIRANQLEAMPDSCTVKRFSSASDGYGGTTQTWATLATYACRVAPAASPREQVLAGKVASQLDWMVTLPYNADCTAKDRILVGSRTLEVQGAVQGESWQTALRVLCKEVAA